MNYQEIANAIDEYIDEKIIQLEEEITEETPNGDNIIDYETTGLNTKRKELYACNHALANGDPLNEEFHNSIDLYKVILSANYFGEIDEDGFLVDLEG